MNKKLAIMVIILFCLIFVASCTSGWRRVMRHGGASVDDYKIFPSRQITRSANTRVFNNNPDPRYEDLIKVNLGCDNLDVFLEDSKTQSLIILSGETIVLEKYANQANSESIVTSFSVSKSFISAMIGKLIEDNKIQSVDQPITDYLPELRLRDRRFSDITIRDLMLMCSGLKYFPFPDVRADDVHTYYDANLRRAALSRSSVVSKPGGSFSYNNYNPLLLGMIIERVTGDTVSAYLQNKIWQPMGAISDASWSLDSKLSGFEKMESGLNAHAMDFVRFGALYRDNGLVNGNRVLQLDWIQESTAELASRSTEEYYRDSFGKKIFHAMHGGYYSHFWYGLQCKDTTRDDFFAAGNKGQIIYVSPRSNLVIVRFGREDGIDFWRWISAFYEIASVISAQK